MLCCVESSGQCYFPPPSMMARNAWCFVTCYQYLCGRVYILFRFVVDNPHSPSPNTFSLYVLGLYPAPLDVNVSERLLSHDSPVQHTESLFTVPGCDSAKEPLSRLFSEEEGTILAVVETVVRFFFSPQSSNRPMRRTPACQRLHFHTTLFLLF